MKEAEKHQILCLFTGFFPRSRGEQFIENELPFLAGEFEHVYVFPLKKGQKNAICRRMLRRFLLQDELSKQQKSLGKYFGCLALLVREIINGDRGVFYLKKPLFFLQTIARYL